MTDSSERHLAGISTQLCSVSRASVGVWHSLAIRKVYAEPALFVFQNRITLARWIRLILDTILNIRRLCILSKSS